MLLLLLLLVVFNSSVESLHKGHRRREKAELRALHRKLLYTSFILVFERKIRSEKLGTHRSRPLRAGGYLDPIPYLVRSK